MRIIELPLPRIWMAVVGVTAVWVVVIKIQHLTIHVTLRKVIMDNVFCIAQREVSELDIGSRATVPFDLAEVKVVEGFVGCGIHYSLRLAQSIRITRHFFIFLSDNLVRIRTD